MTRALVLWSLIWGHKWLFLDLLHQTDFRVVMLSNTEVLDQVTMGSELGYLPHCQGSQVPTKSNGGLFDVKPNQPANLDSPINLNACFWEPENP